MTAQLEHAERERSAGLRAYAISVQRAQEEERERISRELHDDICQRLSGMKFRVEVLAGGAEPANKRMVRGLRVINQELDPGNHRGYSGFPRISVRAFLTTSDL